MSETNINTNGTSLPDEVLMSRIYVFRDQKVMLDRDLAELYGVETKQLKRQVRRNIDRFPEDFMFELSKEEYEILRSQIGTLGHGTCEIPTNDVYGAWGAHAVNIQIMRVFTKLRQFLTDNSRIQHELTEMRLAIEKLSKKQKGHDQNIELLFEYIDRVQEKQDNAVAKPRSKGEIGFKIGESKKVRS